MHFNREPFLFPNKLSEILEDFFIKESGAKIKQIGEQLSKLWPQLAEQHGRDQKNKHYAQEQSFTKAYAAYYLPINLMKIPLVLEEMKILGLPMPSNKLRWLDIGCGPGTAFWGLSWWAEAYKIQTEYTGIDYSKSFLSIAEELQNKLVKKFPHHIAKWQVVEKQNPTEKIIEAIEKEAPHVVSFMNSWCEMPGNMESRISLIEKIFATLEKLEKKDGTKRFLLLLEPGSKESSRQILQLREKIKNGAAQASILLPCMDARPCGAYASERDWCHEEAACVFPQWVNEVGKLAGLKKEALLFSYLLLGTNIDRKDQDLLLNKAKFRIVSQRLENKGYVQCYFCSPEKKFPARVQNKNRNEQTEIFFNAVRGQLFSELKTGDKTDIENYAELITVKNGNEQIFPRATR